MNNFLSDILGFLFVNTGAIHTLPQRAHTVANTAACPAGV